MTTRFYFQNIKESDKRLLEKYFHEKKFARLQKLLQRPQGGRSNFELAKFVVNVKYHERHSIFIVRLGLNFAGRDLRGEEKSHGGLLEAFDLAFDRIISQLRKVGFPQDLLR